VARLLRWYPRAWRERYGDEFLATVQDILDGGAPTLHLRLSVAWAGLRERGHQVWNTGKAAARRLKAGRNGASWSLLWPIAGLMLAFFPLNLRTSPLPAREWQATGSLDTGLGFAAFGGVAILASALIAAPAFGRFLRAGGWPQIRRRVGWAAAATAAAGGGLCWIAIASAAKTFNQLNVTLNYLLGIGATGVLFAVALGLWTDAAKGTARHLGLSRRVRAVETVLIAVSAAAAAMMVSASMLFTAAVQSSVPMLLLGVVGIAGWGFIMTMNLRRAVRKGRRLWSAPGRG
jgi:hypothetical protein